MRPAIAAVGAVCLGILCCGAVVAGTQRVTTEARQKRPRVRAQVVGYGKNAASAITDARSSAAKVAGTYYFTVVSQRTTGKDGGWTCILIIEYEVK